MERLPAVPDGLETRIQDNRESAPGSIHEDGSVTMNEDAPEELDSLGSYLAMERELEKEEIRRRSRRVKWMESRRRHKREA
jgi:predicted phosphoribosyltransferase